MFVVMRRDSFGLLVLQAAFAFDRIVMLWHLLSKDGFERKSPRWNGGCSVERVLMKGLEKKGEYLLLEDAPFRNDTPRSSVAPKVFCRVLVTSQFDIR